MMTFSDGSSWVILSEIEQSIKQKVEAAGTPLSEWDVNIYRGILTGYNDAFIISTEKRDEILGTCESDEERQRTADIIRPILRGRDIHRYGTEWANLWIISTFPALHYNIENYPSLKAYLLSIGLEKLEQTGKEHIINGQKIKSRKKTNNKWFETQDSISYWDDLSKPKIIWGEISDKSKFFLDDEGCYYPEATTFLMTGSHLHLLLAFLNCKLSEYLFSKIGTTTGVGTVRWKKFKIEKLPVPRTLPKIAEERIISLSQKASSLRSDGLDSSETEHLIDCEIYSVFELTQEEIDYIENR